jgi:response regulator RpfG family c-di-GMP phosphodiesterase
MNHSILVVDPTPDDQIDSILSGYKIIYKTSGEEALRYIETNSPLAIVISEFQLGGKMDGMELFGKLETISPRTLRLLLTDSFSELDYTYAKERGHIHEFLSKPFQPKELSEKVTSLLKFYEETTD